MAASWMKTCPEIKFIVKMSNFNSLKLSKARPTEITLNKSYKKNVENHDGTKIMAKLMK